MKSLPIVFLQFMPAIRVLDLSGNENLVELPLEICQLKSLEYLSLVGTGIGKMPIELKNLTKLRCLILGCVIGLEVIPPNVISCLSNLQTFRIRPNSSWNIKEDEEGHVLSAGFMVVLQELECLQYLSEITITLLTVPLVQKFLTSQKLQKRTQHLAIGACWGLKEVELPHSTLQKLRVLGFNNCYDLERVKINKGNEEKPGFSGGHISNSNFYNLVDVFIRGCRFLDLTWLIHAPNLESLIVLGSHEMEEIIWSDERGDSEIEQQNLSIFSRLVELQLHDLPNLKSICRWALPFPSLKQIYVSACPNLRKLPLNSTSATNTLKVITGGFAWWDDLEWEDDNLRRTFAPRFIPCEVPFGLRVSEGVSGDDILQLWAEHMVECIIGK